MSRRSLPTPERLSAELQPQHGVSAEPAHTIVQLGYVGSVSRHLFNLRDINQAAPVTTSSTIQSTRPYAVQFPTFAAINQA